MCKIRIRELFLVSTVVWVLSSYAFAQSKNISEEDGTDWLISNSISDAHKLGIIKGVVLGTSTIHVELETYLKSAVPTDNKNIASIMHNLTIEHVLETLKSLSLFDITIGQIKDGIDALYKDFSNRRIKIIDAIFVVKMQIEGKDPDLIQMQLRYLRMQPLNTKAWGEAIEKISEIMKKRKEKEGYNDSFSNEDIKNGIVTEQDLLYYGTFVDKNNINHNLFCYGIYH